MRKKWVRDWLHCQLVWHGSIIRKWENQGKTPPLPCSPLPQLDSAPLLKWSANSKGGNVYGFCSKQDLDLFGTKSTWLTNEMSEAHHCKCCCLVQTNGKNALFEEWKLRGMNRYSKSYKHTNPATSNESHSSCWGFSNNEVDHLLLSRVSQKVMSRSILWFLAGCYISVIWVWDQGLLLLQDTTCLRFLRNGRNLILGCMWFGAVRKAAINYDRELLLRYGVRETKYLSIMCFWCFPYVSKARTSKGDFSATATACSNPRFLLTGINFTSRVKRPARAPILAARVARITTEFWVRLFLGGRVTLLRKTCRSFGSARQKELDLEFFNERNVYVTFYNCTVIDFSEIDGNEVIAKTIWMRTMQWWSGHHVAHAAKAHPKRKLGIIMKDQASLVCTRLVKSHAIFSQPPLLCHKLIFKDFRIGQVAKPKHCLRILAAFLHIIDVANIESHDVSCGWSQASLTSVSLQLRIRPGGTLCQQCPWWRKRRNSIGAHADCRSFLFQKTYIIYV